VNQLNVEAVQVELSIPEEFEWNQVENYVCLPLDWKTIKGNHGSYLFLTSISLKT